MEDIKENLVSNDDEQLILDFWDDKVYTVYYNEEYLEVYYGKNDGIRKQRVFKDNLQYKYENNVEQELEENGDVTNYIGEIILFRDQTLSDQIWFISILSDIGESLKNGSYGSLQDALKDISKLFALDDDMLSKITKNIEKYLFDIAFIYWIIKETNNLPFAEEMYDWLIVGESKKDFVSEHENQKLIVRKEDVTGENFVVNVVRNLDDEMFDIFLHYVEGDEEAGMSANDMLAFIYKALPSVIKIEPRNILIGKFDVDYNDLKINLENLEVIFIDNRNLPILGNQDVPQNMITNVEYELYIKEYINECFTTYNVSSEMNDFLNKLKEVNK